MLKKFAIILLSTASLVALGQPVQVDPISQSDQPIQTNVIEGSMQKYVDLSERCEDLNCVRNNIDGIDSQIVTLLGERLAFVKRAGELKAETTPVHDRVRENRIMNKVGLEAQMIGYPPVVARAVYITILTQSNMFEQRFKR